MPPSATLRFQLQSGAWTVTVIVAGCLAKFHFDRYSVPMRGGCPAVGVSLNLYVFLVSRSKTNSALNSNSFTSLDLIDFDAGVQVDTDCPL